MKKVKKAKKREISADFLTVKLVLESDLANKRVLMLMAVLRVQSSNYPACTLPSLPTGPAPCPKAAGSELGPLPGVNQAVDAEAVVEVAVELSALPAAKRVVVNSTVEMQALAVLRRARVRPAVAQVVRAEGRNVPVGQLVHQSQGALPAGGPRAERGHAAVKVVETRGRGQPRRRGRGRALVVLVRGLHLRRGRPQQLGAVGGLRRRRRRRPPVLHLSGPRGRSRRSALIRPSFPFPAEIPVIEHLLTVGVQSPIISFSWKRHKTC